jgi:ABC-2 type transport system permease protein
MPKNIFSKTFRDRWFGTAIAVLSLILLLYFAMSIYRNIDLGIYTDLPEAFRTILGISANADIGSLAIGVFFTSYGAWVLAGLAIASSSASITGEESNGTIGILLGNPKSRTNVILSKIASMTLITALAVLLLWGAMYLVSGMLNVSISGMHVGALGIHLCINTRF